jgi:hypothetical protein
MIRMGCDFWLIDGTKSWQPLYCYLYVYIRSVLIGTVVVVGVAIGAIPKSQIQILPNLGLTLSYLLFVKKYSDESQYAI